MPQVTFLDIQQDEHDVVEPVTLAEAKAQCRVDFSDDDTAITTLISQCRQSIENYCHIAIVSKTLTASVELRERRRGAFRTVSTGSWVGPYRDFDGYDEFELPYGPVKTFTSLSYVSQDGSFNALNASTDFQLFGSLYKTIRINNSYENNVLIYESGYATGKVPADLKLGILNEIAYRYDEKGNPNDNIRATAFTEEGVCQAARVLIEKYRRMAWL